MIPTTPTQNAFTPWWPTFTTQFVSLLFTWLGLWWTSRGLDKHPEAHDMTLPLTFWIQLPIDIGRIIAWFVKTIHGFTDAKRFAWVSYLVAGKRILQQMMAKQPARRIHWGSPQNIPPFGKENYRLTKQ
ncbi:hypothetical protein LTR66_000499 [Elasticomyces elasticus]|nr:hypothetical protein LTR66_000499 [Elasticomyces elasticus]